MRTTKWVQVSDKAPFFPTKQSGGEGVQLGGFDGRDRIIAQPNGVNRTPDIIASPGSHVPKAKKELEPIDGTPAANKGPKFRSPATVKVGWQNKGRYT
jgi:hypothetical protein